MQFIYIRHGITQYSIENRFAGRRDIPLVGVNNDYLTRSFDLVKKYKPKLILHSPLLRAVQTANHFIAEFNNIICEPLLIERDFGLFEGKVKTTNNRTMLEKQNASVESLAKVEDRAICFLHKYSHIENTFLVVGHSAFYRSLSKVLSLPSALKLECCEAIIIDC